MKIALFTANQPRHIALMERLAAVADELFVIQDCNTVFPGEVEDFYRQSPVMREYFNRVRAAEAEVFGNIRFAPEKLRHLALKCDDLSRVDMKVLAPALASDVYIVFGASYIKGPLVTALIERRTINIHMGVSPYYRGANCNFWAMYDQRPEMVGATLHLLSAGLDSGPVIRHVFPKCQPVDAFVYGMLSVKAAHIAVEQGIADGSLLRLDAVAQDRSIELRYARNSEFTDERATEYLSRLPPPDELAARLATRQNSLFLRPVFY